MKTGLVNTISADYRLDELLNVAADAERKHTDGMQIEEGRTDGSEGIESSGLNYFSNTLMEGPVQREFLIFYTKMTIDGTLIQNKYNTIYGIG